MFMKVIKVWKHAIASEIWEEKTILIIWYLMIIPILCLSWVGFWILLSRLLSYSGYFSHRKPRNGILKRALLFSTLPTHQDKNAFRIKYQTPFSSFSFLSVATSGRVGGQEACECVHIQLIECLSNSEAPIQVSSYLEVYISSANCLQDPFALFFYLWLYLHLFSISSLFFLLLFSLSSLSQSLFFLLANVSALQLPKCVFFSP